MKLFRVTVQEGISGDRGNIYIVCQTIKDAYDRIWREDREIVNIELIADTDGKIDLLLLLQN